MAGYIYYLADYPIWFLFNTCLSSNITTATTVAAVMSYIANLAYS